MSRQLVARGIAFAYPSTPDRIVLDKVNLAVATGDRIGVVGENGSGKSTLLSLLAGRLEPTSGTIVRRGSFAVVEQELDAGEETLGELVAASLEAARLASLELERRLTSEDLREVSDAVERWEVLRAWDADRVLDEALTRFGVPRDLPRPLSQFSVGERYRARLACRLAEASDLLLLDEPTNHLDAAALDHLTHVLATWPGAVVVVTHDRRLLDDVATAILDLDPTVDGVPARYGASAGNGATVAFSYATYRRAKDAALVRWRSRYHREQLRLTELYDERDRAYENLSDEWRPLKGSQKNRRGTRARQHVKNADRQHEKLMSVAVEVPPPPPELTLPPLLAVPTNSADDGAAILSLTGAVVPGRLERPDLGLELGVGGRLLVVGANGTGKSTLLGLLRDAGAPGVRVGVLAQEPSFGASELRTAEELATARILEALAAGTVDPVALVPIAATGLVAEELLERPVAELSVGQRRRIDLALTLMTSPHVLVLDEPTNHLAVDLMDDLTAWLDEVGAAVVVATHDRRMRADLGPDGADWPVLDLG